MLLALVGVGAVYVVEAPLRENRLDLSGAILLPALLARRSGVAGRKVDWRVLGGLRPAPLAERGSEAFGDVVLQLPRVVRGVEPAAQHAAIGGPASSHARHATRGKVCARRRRGVGEAWARRALGVGEALAGAHPSHRMRNCARPLRRRSPRMRSTANTFESPSASASASRPPTPCTSTPPGSNLTSMPAPPPCAAERRGRLVAADSPAIGRGRLGGGAPPLPPAWSVASPSPDASRSRQGTATFTPESRRVAALSGGAPCWLRGGD
eukprot:scaffold52858_cov57-Phaeocystis_antarctica.AAC.1